MRASPQRPGPGGSRVLKKRSSIPRLGDRLPTVFTHDVSFANSTAHNEAKIFGTLTSSNLDRLAKVSHSNSDLVLADTLSIHSDEDIVLIGTPSRSMKSNSSSHHSSRTSTPRGDETPPTTLTGDDSYCSSDDEITLNLPTPVIDQTLFGSTLSAIHGLDDNEVLDAPTSKIQEPSHFTIPFSEPADVLSHVPHRPTNKLPNPLEPTPFRTTASTVSNGGVVPDAESLHGIVRGFLAAGPSAKNISLPIMDPGAPVTTIPVTPDRAKPFWEPQRIFQFYIKGAITPERAKETAKRYGYPYVITVIENVEHLKQTNPSLHISDIVSKASRERSHEDLVQHKLVSSVTRQQNWSNIEQQRFMLKLAKCCAKDNTTDTPKPLHIFVDMSNIHIGFCNSWKISQNIPVDQRIRAPTFNFKVLAFIIERNRAVKKKFLASSVASHVISRAQWPQHFIDAEGQGYKTSILNRVQKVSPVKVGRRHKASQQVPGTVHFASTVTSGEESGEDVARIGYETRNGEQGVDEILHLNMMNSIIDDIHEPGNMVLATGDAAQAEFSEGFLKYATRALSQGWNLELVTWKRTISSAWVDPAFMNEFEGRFRIIYLDDFLEELNADLCPSLAQRLDHVDVIESIT
ncbi:hypothetical protein F5B22DRAFT_652163 [Xylaria bambusicola]|uniref:uncharacterized protein n=1 Tax=Xylaria bambusicola TaxID=326684 RepID=UPI002008A55E|nr:uncharacterized protein F5B22DRAFT_652163 [Xylaria bambusicola]KAI0503319.1 hypothetical protein F5B22DRAFT_652163 [Xylaria bambusicola]